MNDSNHCFQLSPLIRGTLITVYLALVLPLPALAPESLRLWLLAAVPLGLLVVLAMLSEQVTVTSSGITVGPPSLVQLVTASWLEPELDRDESARSCRYESRGEGVLHHNP